MLHTNELLSIKANKVDQLIEEIRILKENNMNIEYIPPKNKAVSGTTTTSLSALLSAKNMDNSIAQNPPPTVTPVTVPVVLQSNSNITSETVGNNQNQLVSMYKTKNEQLLMQVRELQLQLEIQDKSRVDNITNYQQSNNAMKNEYESLLNKISLLQERIHELETTSTLELMKYTEKCREFERESNKYEDKVCLMCK